MRREIEDFIRDEESQFEHDDKVVCTCDNCGDLILVGQDMMVFVAKDGMGVRICEKCYNSMAPDEVLDLASIWYYVGDSDNAESFLNTKLIDSEARHD